MLNQHVTCAIARRTWVDSDWLSNLDEIIQVYADTLCQLGRSHTCNALNCAAREAHVVPFEDLVNLDVFGVLVTATSKTFQRDSAGML